MALPLYVCSKCQRRDDDPTTPYKCISGYGHCWSKVLGYGPEMKEDIIGGSYNRRCSLCALLKATITSCSIKECPIFDNKEEEMKANGEIKINPNYCQDYTQKGNLKYYCTLLKDHKEDHKFGEEKKIFPGGAASTKIPGFKYIPRVALERLAKRFELGLERHKENSWNALNPDSASMLDDREWLIERLNHVIHHAYKEIERLSNPNLDPLAESDDNAAAIMWGGACLIAADERMKDVLGEVPEDCAQNNNS
jgi:hypothetical protein